MPGTTQLRVYNDILTELGSDKLSSLSEAHERRYVIDNVFADVVEEALEDGQWNFATRTVKLDADGSIDPAFGPTEVFAKPSDWLRTVGFSTSESGTPSLQGFLDEQGYWLGNSTPIYVRYVSSDATYGLAYSRWPKKFTRYVVLLVAERVCDRLTQDNTKRERITSDLKRAKQSAFNKDAMNDMQPVQQPVGSWVGARGGWHGDRGSRSRLIG